MAKVVRSITVKAMPAAVMEGLLMIQNRGIKLDTDLSMLLHEDDDTIEFQFWEQETEAEIAKRQKAAEDRKLSERGFEVAQMKLLMSKYPEECGRG